LTFWPAFWDSIPLCNGEKTAQFHNGREGGSVLQWGTARGKREKNYAHVKIKE